jgi:hypothetical protein
MAVSPKLIEQGQGSFMMAATTEFLLVLYSTPDLSDNSMAGGLRRTWALNSSMGFFSFSWMKSHTSHPFTGAPFNKPLATL